MHPRSTYGRIAAALATLVWTLTACGSDAPDPAPEAASAPAASPAPAPSAAPPEPQIVVPPTSVSKFVPGPLPDGFPTDLPLPDDAELIGSYSGETGGFAARWESKGALAEVAQSMQAGFPDLGWQIEQFQLKEDRGAVFVQREEESLLISLMATESGSAIEVFANTR